MEWYKNSRQIRIDITRICVEFAYHCLKEWCVAFAYPFTWAELKHHSAIRLRVPSNHYSGRLCRSWALSPFKKVLELVHETGLMSLTMMNGSYSLQRSMISRCQRKVAIQMWLFSNSFSTMGRCWSCSTTIPWLVKICGAEWLLR